MRLVSAWLRTERFWTCLVVVMALGLWAFVSPPSAGGPAAKRTALPSAETGIRNTASQLLAPPDNLLIVTLDTTRADRLGAYGYRVQTPHLDRLARDGVLFEQTTSAAPLTLPAHGSLLTGRFPPAHRVRGNGGFFSDLEHLTLAEILKHQQFRTGAFVGSYVLDSTFGLDQGFETYVDDFDGPISGSVTASNLQRRADEVVDAASRWLEQTASSRFFAWLHFYDPHAPYDPPEPYRTMFEDDPYVGEIAFVDSQIGRLLAFLDHAHLLDRTLIVVMGDHGEGLGEHDEPTHGRSVYESVMRVPFIIRVPQAAMAGVRIVEPTRSVDALPTILDLLDISAPSRLDGTSLVPLILEPSSHLDLEVYGETLYPQQFGSSGLRMLRSGQFKLIDAGEGELYDLHSDPGEQHSLFDERRELAARLSRDLRDLEQHLTCPTPQTESRRKRGTRSGVSAAHADGLVTGARR